MAAGWATLASRAFLAMALVVYVLRMPEARTLGIFAKPIGGPIAAAGGGASATDVEASMFIEIGAFAAMTAIAGQLGGLQAAAWASILNVAAIIFMAPLSLSSATAVRWSAAPSAARDQKGDGAGGGSWGSV